MAAPLLSVRDLTVRFRTDEGMITAVDGISFDIAAGEVLGLVGESGSGKSVTAKALMRLNPGNTDYAAESRIVLHTEGSDVDVLALKRARDLMVVRGGAVSMIFQEPMASFAPAITIGDQMVEQLLLHTGLTKRQARAHAVEMLGRVGIPDPNRRIDQYAFEFSGRMRQRAMIAMALSTGPKLLIADEPTTALDVTIQAQVLDLMLGLVAEMGMAILFITHDLGVIAQTADRVAVMYLGRIAETGAVRQVIRHAAHPYTRGLLNALPNIDDPAAPLVPVPGDIPSPLERPAGCVFHTRCAQAIAGLCDVQVPAPVAIAPGHAAACFALAPAPAPVERPA